MNDKPSEDTIPFLKDNANTVQQEIDPELECVVCNDILFQPVSINCGHSFCKECLINILRTKPQCPLCRTPTFLQESNLKQNVVLQSVIENKYPEQIKRRKASQVVISNEDPTDQIQEGEQRAPVQLPPLLVFNLMEDKQLVPQTIEKLKIKCDWNLQFFSYICPDKRVICLNTSKPVELPKLCFVLEVIKMDKQSETEATVVVRVLNRVLLKQLQQIECDNPEFLQQLNLSKSFSTAVARAEEYVDLPFADIAKLEETLQPLRIFVRAKLTSLAQNSPHAFAMLASRFPNFTMSNLLMQRTFEQISEETLLLVSMLNMEAATKIRLLETKNIMERLVILQQVAADLEHFNESTKIFDLTGSGGNKTSLLYSLVPLIVVILAVIFFKYTKVSH